ncbi:MAG: type II secretion system secretin GspD [Sedimentisphaerales bacterium]|nr:type II secretion system secretin GspD [Sedimentisphaerales bacterium]
MMNKLVYDKYKQITRDGFRHLCILIFLFIFFVCMSPSFCSADSASSDNQYGDDSTAKDSTVFMPLLSEPGAADKMISLDFDQADIRVFIKTIGHLTGINFLIDDNVRGTVTLISPTQVRLGEAYKILESVLQVKGYAAVPVGKLVKIVPRTDAAKSNLSIRVGNNPELIPEDDSFVTQIIPLHFANVAEISGLLTPFVSTGGNITAYPNANTVILTDTSSNIHRIVKLIRELDIEGAEDDYVVIRLKYGSAQTISEQITQIIQRNSAASGTRNVRTASAADNDLMKIMPDERTNSLIVVTKPDEIEMIQDLIAKLDVERPLETGNVHVIFLKHAEAAEVAKSLSAVLVKLSSGVTDKSSELLQITSDESTNSLIVVASPQDYEIIENMIEKLDIVREQVLVEFQIIEATNDVLKEIGVDWATLDEAVADSFRGFGYTNLGPRAEAASGTLEGLGVGVFKEVGGETEIGAILKALEKHSKVNILSTPHILTSNHQKATIIVADNVPYIKQSRVTETDVDSPTAIQTYDFKDVGIELGVIPHVSQGGFVRLDIDASFSKLIEGTTGLSSSTPTTAQRKVNTNVSIVSGTTVVIGGLMRDDNEIVEKKVPLLGDLPLIGGLFRVSKNSNLKTNLLLFITPHVLANQEDLVEITKSKQQESQESAENKK